MSTPGLAGGTRAAAYGVDVGGTNILGVAVDRGGTLLAERRAPTPGEAVAVADPHAAGADAAGTGAPGAGRAADALADAIATLVEQLHEELPQGLGAGGSPTDVPLGIGLAGLVDGEGVLRFSPHLSAVSGANVGELVTARLGGGAHAARTLNDANCAALAELRLGAARDVRDGLVVLLGTGIGGALVRDGRVHGGPRGFAGEIGHMVVDPSGPPCPCGGRGCWERFASGSALTRLAREAAAAGTLDEAVRLAGGDPRLVTGEHVAVAATEGDAGARRVVEELGWWLGLGLANLVAILDPEVVVVGGGVGRLGELLLEPARRALGALVEGGAARGSVDVVGAALGERAGAVGAALAALAALAGCPDAC